ncbi:MAG: type IV toxin-antitoxin system AbiEi family antitoxin domain-containing protein [Nocardioides sp.]
MPVPGPIAELLDVQCGVLSRAQALTGGLAPHDLRSMVRRRELTPVHHGVYVDHTGPLCWQQRAWAAVLAFAPAALCHRSAIRAARGPGWRDRDEQGPIHVAVARERRTLVVPDGVVLHHLADVGGKSLWNTSPPRVRIEHAVLDVAAEAGDELASIATLADGIQGRLTTPDRILAALDSRSRIARRDFLRAVLTDVAAGACSALEHGYLTLVERPHGLPAAERQVRDSARGTIYRDVRYAAYGVDLELDGRLFHDNARARDLDLARDLASAVSGRQSVRLGWGQVFGSGCHTAEAVGSLLQRGGWPGTTHPCPACPVAA